MATQTWQDIALRKQTERDSLIPPEWKLDLSKYAGRTNFLGVPAECGILSEKQLDITSNYDAVDLLTKIKDSTFSVEDVVTAFCARAAIAQQLTNCLTEIFFDEAIQRARALDLQRAENPNEPLGKLFGLPISLKDVFMVPGTDATAGFIYHAHDKSATYAKLCELLLSEGAVFYCKTNVPQTVMTTDTHNNVFGRTLNPHNTKLTAGGSTGGEGALIAMRGSVVGIGADIAGSIRIPAHCNGIYGFKPSVGVVPQNGLRPVGQLGLAGIASVTGPMATSARANTRIMQVVMEAKAWKYDSTLNHIHWQRLTLPNRALRIGVVEDDTMSMPTPPMRRMMAEACGKLKGAQIELVPLQLPNAKEAQDLTILSLSMDSFKGANELIQASGEPVIPSVQNIGLLLFPARSLPELYDFTVSRTAIQEQYQKLWLDNALDALIMPPAPFVAPKIDSWTTVNYTSLWNLMDYPAAVIPFGKVHADDVVPDQDTNDMHGYTGPKDFADAPTTIQVVGMRQEDEYLSLVVQKLDEILNG